MFAGSGWTPGRSTLANLEAAVDFALRPLAEYLVGLLKADHCVGCDDTGVVLITPKALPDLSNHPRGERINEVLGEAIESGKPSVSAKFWGYYASRLAVVAFDFTVSRHRDAGCPSLYQLITSEPEPAVEQSDDRCLRSESQQLAAFSVGLRRSEIDGHFENCRLTPPA